MIILKMTIFSTYIPIPVGSGNGNNVTMSLEDQDGNDDVSVLGSTFSKSEKITLSFTLVRESL